MRYQAAIFCMAALRQIRSAKVWMAILLMPLMILFLQHALPRDELTAPVRVGVALPSEGAEALWQRIEQRSGTVVTFLRADEGEIRRQVASSHWDCGVLVPDDFEDRIRQSDTDDIFTVIIGDGSTVYPVVQETLSVCLMELWAPQIAEDYLQSSGIVEEDVIPHQRLEKVLSAADRVQIKTETVDGQPMDPLTLAENTTAFILRGVTAMILLIWMLFVSMDLGKWLESPAVRRLRPLRSVTALLLPKVLAEALPALCSGLLSMYLLSDLRAAVLLLLYMACLSMMALALAQFRCIWNAIPVLMPFVPVLCLMFSPIIPDISLFLPNDSLLSAYSPVALFLYACVGKTGAVWGLCGITLTIPLLMGLLDRVKTAASRHKAG